MKVVKDFLKVFGTAQMLTQAVRYLALVLVLALVPKASWLIMLGAAVILLIFQALFIYSGSDGSTVVVNEKEDGSEG